MIIKMERKSFYYPATQDREAHRMCVAGQRRAAMEAWNLLVPGGDKGVTSTLTRAGRAEMRLRKGADASKHSLISLVVVDRVS